MRGSSPGEEKNLSHENHEGTKERTGERKMEKKAPLEIGTAGVNAKKKRRTPTTGGKFGITDIRIR